MHKTFAYPLVDLNRVAKGDESQVTGKEEGVVVWELKLETKILGYCHQYFFLFSLGKKNLTPGAPLSRMTLLAWADPRGLLRLYTPA